MQRLFFYNILLFFISTTSFCQNPALKWENEVKSYEAQDSIKGISTNGILFTGSSSIRLWNDLPERFSGEKVLNRGIGGSEISDLIFYADRLIFPYKPQKIFIYCGGNDVWKGKSPEIVLEDFKTLYARIKQKLPKTEIYYISIQSAPSREEKNALFRRANEQIKAYLEHNTRDVFIDVFPLLLGQDRKPKAEFFLDDQLHMNSKGYDRWTRVLKAYVKK